MPLLSSCRHIASGTRVQVRCRICLYVLTEHSLKKHLSNFHGINADDVVGYTAPLELHQIAYPAQPASYNSVLYSGLRVKESNQITAGKKSSISPHLDATCSAEAISVPTNQVESYPTKEDQPGAMAVDLSRVSSSPRKKLKCVYCDDHFATESLKLIHMSLKHSSKVKENWSRTSRHKFKCVYCTECFATESLKSIHEHLYHSPKVMGAQNPTKETTPSQNHIISDETKSSLDEGFITKHTGDVLQLRTQNISPSNQDPILICPSPECKSPTGSGKNSKSPCTNKLQRQSVTSPSDHGKHKSRFLKCAWCRFKCKSDSLLAMHIKIYHTQNLGVIKGYSAEEPQRMLSVGPQEPNNVYGKIAKEADTAGTVENHSPPPAISQTQGRNSGCLNTPGLHPDELKPNESDGNVSADDNFIQSLVVPDPVFGGFKEIRLYKPPNYSESHNLEICAAPNEKPETAVAKSVIANDDVIDVSDDSGDDNRESGQSKKVSKASSAANPICTVNWRPSLSAANSTQDPKTERNSSDDIGPVLSENILVIKPMTSPKCASSGVGSDFNVDSPSRNASLGKSLPEIQTQLKRKSQSLPEDLCPKVVKVTPSSRELETSAESTSNDLEDSTCSGSSVLSLSSSPKMLLKIDVENGVKNNTRTRFSVSNCDMQGLPENEEEDDRPIFSWNNPDLTDQRIPSDISIQVTHSKPNSGASPSDFGTMNTCGDLPESKHSPASTGPNEEMIDKLIHQIQEFSNVHDCTICDANFSTNLELLAHVQGHSKFLRCLSCNLKFSNVIEINRHIQQSHIDRDSRVLSGLHPEEKHFKCLHCDRSFTTDMGRKMHSKLVHTLKIS